MGSTGTSTIAPGATPPATAPADATGMNAAAGAQTTPNVNGYRLSGINMSAWSGQRVQVVGIVVPAPTPGSPSSGAIGTSGTSGQTLPEFRVQSVQPLTGNCPQQ